MTRHDASAHELVENLRFSSPAHVVEEGRPAAIHMYWYMCCDTVQVSGGAQRFRLQSYANAIEGRGSRSLLFPTLFCCEGEDPELPQHDQQVAVRAEIEGR